MRNERSAPRRKPKCARSRPAGWPDGYPMSWSGFGSTGAPMKADVASVTTHEPINDPPPKPYETRREFLERERDNFRRLHAVAAVSAPAPHWRDVPAKLRPAILHLREVTFVRTKPSVYFLLDGEEVVYVGQTVHLAARVQAHQARFQFDRVLYVHVSREEDLDAVEATFIKALKPKGNRSGGNARPRRISTVLDWMEQN